MPHQAASLSEGDSMPRKAAALCAYCDASPAVTRDHVVPKCLFSRPYPPNLVTVPACLECNRDKAIDDDFLRDYLTVDFAGSESPIASEIFETKMRRSVSRNSSELGREILRNARMRPFYTKGGVYLGEFAQADIPEDRVTRVLGRLIRGLFFHYAKQRIPKHYPVEALRIMPWDIEDAWRSFGQLNLSPCRPMGEVFAGSCARVQEDPLSTAWLLSFYRRVHLHVYCVNPDLPRMVAQDPTG